MRTDEKERLNFNI